MRVFYRFRTVSGVGNCSGDASLTSFTIRAGHTTVNFSGIFASNGARTTSLCFHTKGTRVAIGSALVMAQIGSFPGILRRCFRFLIRLVHASGSATVLQHMISNIKGRIHRCPNSLLAICGRLKCFFEVLRFSVTVRTLHLRAIHLSHVVSRFGQLHSLQVRLRLTYLRLYRFRRFANGFRRTITTFSGASNGHSLLVIRVSCAFVLRRFRARGGDESQNFRFVKGDESGDHLNEIWLFRLNGVFRRSRVTRVLYLASVTVRRVSQSVFNLGVTFLVVYVSLWKLLFLIILCRFTCRPTRRIIFRHRFNDELSRRVLAFRVRSNRHLVVDGGGKAIPVRPSCQFDSTISGHFGVFFNLSGIDRHTLPMFHRTFHRPIRQKNGFNGLLIVTRIRSLFMVIIDGLRSPINRFASQQHGKAKRTSRRDGDGRSADRHSGTGPWRYLIHHALNCLTFPMSHHRVRARSVIGYRPSALCDHVIRIPIRHLVLYSRVHHHRVLISLHSVLLLRVRILFGLHAYLQVILSPFRNVRRPTEVGGQVVVVHRSVLHIKERVHGVLRDRPTRRGSRHGRGTSPRNRFHFCFRSWRLVRALVLLLSNRCSATAGYPTASYVEGPATPNAAHLRQRSCQYEL